MITKQFTQVVVLSFLAAFTALSSQLALADSLKVSVEKQRIVAHWTPARKAAAIPRDLKIDQRGLGYLRKPDGSFQPHGHSIAALAAEPRRGKPSGGSDSSPPDVTEMLPAEGAVIGASQLFSATLSDPSGIKSVAFVITSPDGTPQSFTPNYAGSDPLGNGVWKIDLNGFSDGNWSWHVVAKDLAAKGGNSVTTDELDFSVNTGSGGSGGSASYIKTNSHWEAGGVVQATAGRLYFEMPSNRKWKRWSGYVCSGTVVKDDDTSGRSIIITAAHCVYDDVNKAFARNVLFIPDQDGTTGSATDRDCGNDPMGCWVPSFGVVDRNWTSTTFPNNIAWDYAYYVVNDIGAHLGRTASSDRLDKAAGSLAIDFDTPSFDDSDPSEMSSDFTHALGYSYSDDPNLMYCAEDMTTEGSVNWWLPSCALSGGASGGPWLQPMDLATGDVTIISVNSWGYTTTSGMAGPKLSGSSAPKLFSEANGMDFGSVLTAEGRAGVIVD